MIVFKDNMSKPPRICRYKSHKDGDNTVRTISYIKEDGTEELIRKDTFTEEQLDEALQEFLRFEL